MSLTEIRALLSAIERFDGDCAPVNALLDEHIHHVAARVAELKQLKSELEAIRAHCQGTRAAKSCGILESLARPAAKRSRAASHVATAHPSRPRPR
jgi:DNA-binding transcriptional MerR regulator